MILNIYPLNRIGQTFNELNSCKEILDNILLNPLFFLLVVFKQGLGYLFVPPFYKLIQMAYTRSIAFLWPSQLEIFEY